ncbi:cytidine deaminase [Clostridium sp. CAG:729]|nr:cytidine deaminase [Clostridium sp. CAG:729]
MNYEELMILAEKASEKAYVPYSKFPVGACILAESGNTYSGCNFENSSFGLTICAERNAVGSAIANGERKLKAVAVFSPKMLNCTPCGACRQVLSEFASDEGIDVIVKTEEGLKVYSLNSLLPENFSL